MSQKPSNNTSPDTQIIPTIKDPQIDSSYINQFAKFILPYIQQDYERELSPKRIRQKNPNNSLYAGRAAVTSTAALLLRAISYINH